MDRGERNLNAAGQVLNLFIDQSIPDKTPFAEVKQKAFSLLEPERFRWSPNTCATSSSTRPRSSGPITARCTSSSNSICGICSARLDFAGLIDDAPLLEAVAFLQELLRQGKSPRQAKPADFPTGILSRRGCSAICTPRPRNAKTSDSK